eukprot:5972388-Prymnesium_polylepis.2
MRQTLATPSILGGWRHVHGGQPVGRPWPDAQQADRLLPATRGLPLFLRHVRELLRRCTRCWCGGRGGEWVLAVLDVGRWTSGSVPDAAITRR